MYMKINCILLHVYDINCRTPGRELVSVLLKRIHHLPLNHYTSEVVQQIHGSNRDLCYVNAVQNTALSSVHFLRLKTVF